MVKDKQPVVLFLIETKLRRDKMSVLCFKMGFDNLIVVNCVGMSGGLAFL